MSGAAISEAVPANAAAVRAEVAAVEEAAACTPLDASRPPLPRHVAKHLLTGTSALGAGVCIERGMGFAANILAARFGGASTFGAYSLAVTTAGNISTYAAGGIGATATRFSGKYPRGSASYPTFARALLVVSLVSAAVAAAGLWLGAGPLAHLLAKPSLVHLLHWAALSAAGMLLLECARGFFVGQRRLAALLLLSALVGVGMLTLLPLAATHHRPIRMITAQGAVTTAAVLVCLLLARPLGLFAQAPLARAAALGPMLREVWSFGMVQLAGLVGMNLAGWWVTTLIARDDTTLVQMSFFAIANQLRNIVGLGPSLLTESSYAIMASADGDRPQTPDQVMAFCTYLSTASSLLLSALGIVIVPWMLTLLYGNAYHAAAAVTALGLAIAVVHMGNSPAAARLTIVSIKTAGVINTVWAVFVAGAGTALLLHGGTAWQAMGIYLAAHIVSAALVLTMLRRHACLPAGMAAIFVIGTVTIAALAGLAFWRAEQPGLAVPLSLGMCLLLSGALGGLVLLGRRHRWLPSRAVLGRILHAVKARLLPVRGADGR